MKRRDLLKVIAQGARAAEKKVTLREGARHTVITVGSTTSIIARHREISSILSTKIMKDFEPEFGKDWWK
jgi:hypothetical protein